MVKIPLDFGVKGVGFRLKNDLPTNLMPQIVADGVSDGVSLTPCPGAVVTDAGHGPCRAVLLWNGEEYRVMGGQFGRVTHGGAFRSIGDVGVSSDPAAMTYSFDRMAIVSGGSAFYYDTSQGLSKITDETLGSVIDVVWVDGYFVFSTTENLIAADLVNPSQINALSYGSSEASPDPIEQLLTLRGEIIAVNRYTIEFFYPSGQGFFPFARNTGAQINRGGAGPRCAAVFQEGVVFLGNGPGEPLGVYAAAGGRSQKISTPAVDHELASLTEAQAARSLVECYGPVLMIHTEIGTFCYDAEASALAGAPCWHKRTTGTAYRLRYFCTRDNVTHVSDAQNGGVGRLSETELTHFGEKITHQTGTMFAFSDANRAIINEIKLQICDEISVGGGQVLMQWSDDGKIWSAGVAVRPSRRDCVIWRVAGRMDHRRAFRFTFENYPCTILRGDIQIEITL